MATSPIILRQVIVVSVGFACLLKMMEVLSVCCLCCGHVQASCSYISCKEACVTRRYMCAVLGPKQLIPLC